MKTYLYVTRNVVNNICLHSNRPVLPVLKRLLINSVRKISDLLASPLTNNDEYIVVVIYGQLFELACIRYGKDTIWTKIKDDQLPKGFEDVADYKGKFYALTFKGTLVCFEYPNPNAEITTFMELVAPNIRRALEGETRRRGGKWIEKKMFGDIALFIGDNSSIAVLASEFNIQPNCIYFTHDEIAFPTKTDRNCDLGAVYNLDNQTFKFNYNLPSTMFHRIFNRSPIWIEPPISSIYVNQLKDMI
ncbi:hypothetical protein F8388_023426 [Cannabis sativa]|uniref:KIB1-4 beta-propeller domain-containing protein n=1 Tax=Cannabis sativa TaxID=3483 RepID=A0A7J6HEA3_CANSA|nr:hypothetical protein F8388_023426 [Cannabis sativa]